MAESLTDTEELALVGLLRMLVRLDGRTSAEEGAAYRTALESCLVAGDGAAKKGFDAKLKALEARADRELKDDDAVRKAAVGVTRKDARDTIFAALADVAAADAIVQAEGALLEWLAREWKIEISEVDGAEEER